MTLYSDFKKQEIVDTGFSSGIAVTQQTFQNVTQSGIVSVTHEEDTGSSRSVQVVELVPEGDNIVDTSLDFDLSDEGDFIQEDAISGTDFIDGKVLLHRILGEYAFEEQQKIQSTDLQPGDRFGFSVSIYDDTAIVGAYYETNRAGAAYIFTRSGSTWTQQQKIQPSDSNTDDYFGYTVSIYGDTVIVGAYYKDVGSQSSGAAYIFTRSGSTWSQQQKIQSTDLQPGDRFGFSVSIYDDTAIVGATYEDTGGESAGAVYIFTRSGSTWAQQQKIQASDPQYEDYFGSSVSIYGDTVIVGASYEDTGGTNAGSAYIFTRSGSTWSQQQKIQSIDLQHGDQFGESVSIYGDTVIVGAIYEDQGAANVGAAYIFTRSDSTWTQQQKIQASDPQDYDQFGESVSIYGDTAIVGAILEDTGGTSAGAAYIFTRSGSTWTQQQKVQASDRQANDQYGCAVAINDDTVIIGSFLEDGGGTDAGAAYILTGELPITYEVDTPYYITTTNINHISLDNVSQILSCTIESSTPTYTSIRCLASFDGRSTWEKWGGASWVTHTGGLTNLQTGNTVTEFQTGFNGLVLASGVGYVDFVFDLGTTNSNVTPSVDLITVNYNEEGYYKLNVLDYEVDYYSSIKTKVIKNSVGAKDIKINVIV